MAVWTEISAATRQSGGKGAARAVRREGRVPGVIYGDKKPPVPISLEQKELWQQLRTGQFLNTIYSISVDGDATRVIPRDVQMDPVRDFPIHVDFLRLGEGARIAVEVPMSFLNEEESPGLKRGGVLNVVRHTIEVRCLAEAIPERLEGDLTGLDIGDSLHVSAIPLPEGVELTITDRDFTVATIAGRMAEIVDEVVEEEDLEGIEGEEGEEGVEGETPEGEEAAGDAEDKSED
ncbi:MAG: 50S ribosomal protein L25/general stress protein Ctc [Hyphomicrobiales bacterium]|nr:50S ribosomal protein L25/general stress protein Ctc [Hyphomicrobiales bacterium]